MAYTNINAMFAEFNDFATGSIGTSVKEKFIRKVREKYVNRYSFEGDKKLTPFIQKQLLSCVFNFGIAAIYKNEEGNYVVVNAYPYWGENKPPYDENGKILYAKGIRYFKRWLNLQGKEPLGKKNVLTLTRDNAAFVFPVDWTIHSITPYDELAPFAKELGNLWEIASYINKQQHNRIIVNEDPSSKKLKEGLKGSDEIITTKGNLESDEQSNSEMNTLKQHIDEEVEVIKFSSDLEKQLSAIEKYTSIIYGLFGIKHTQTFKKARMIKGEVEADKGEYLLNEFTQRQMLETFVEDFNLAFNAKLTLVDNIGEGQDEEINDGDNEFGEDNNVDEGDEDGNF